MIPQSHYKLRLVIPGVTYFPSQAPGPWGITRPPSLGRSHHFPRRPRNGRQNGRQRRACAGPSPPMHSKSHSDPSHCNVSWPAALEIVPPCGTAVCAAQNYRSIMSFGFCGDAPFGCPVNNCSVFDFVISLGVPSTPRICGLGLGAGTRGNVGAAAGVGTGTGAGCSIAAAVL